LTFVTTSHHLSKGTTLTKHQNSQSQRVLWLLEELQIPYNLVHHTRNPPSHPTAPFLAPTSLKSLSQFGKAPLLVTGPGDGSRSIPESLAIVTYLIKTFDHEDKFKLQSGDWIKDEILCSHISSNLGKESAITMMLEMNVLGIGKYGKSLEGASYRKVLGELEIMLKDGPEGDYFGGEELSRADILLEFPLAVSLASLVYCRDEPYAREYLLTYCVIVSVAERQS
jgi:glutathione S-transferase